MRAGRESWPDVLLGGLGHALPGGVVESAEVERELGLPTGWIERRTGVRRRCVASPGEATSDLALAAGSAALADAGLGGADLGLLILATSSPDHTLPPTAPLVAHGLGSSCGAVDLGGACAGFLYGLGLGAGLVQTTGRAVLLVAANVLSRRSDPSDAGTLGLFADAAGAVVLVHRGTAGGGRGRAGLVESLILASQGEHYGTIGIEAGGSRLPLDAEGLARRAHLMRMHLGPRVFRAAVQGMVRTGRAALEAAGVGAENVDLWVPHQANVRITQEVGRRLGLDAGRSVSVIEEHGNSSAASIPLAMSLARGAGRLTPGSGQRLLLTGFGAGLLEGAAVVRV